MAFTSVIFIVFRGYASGLLLCQIEAIFVQADIGRGRLKEPEPTQAAAGSGTAGLSETLDMYYDDVDTVTLASETANGS